MGWRFRQVFRSGPFRWSLSKKGVGWSFGIPGLRYGVSPNAQRYVSVGIPGTGLYYIKYLHSKKPTSAPPTSVSSTPPSSKLRGIPNAQSSPQPPNPSSTTASQPWWKQKKFPK